jgi:hypothetical protein
MTRHVVALRILLVVLVLALGLAGVLLWVASRQIGREVPEVTAFATPVYFVIMAGALPTLWAVVTCFRLLGLVAQGEAFSAAGVAHLATLTRIFGFTAAYALVAYVGCLIALPDVHFMFTLGWLAIELVYLFLAVFIGLLRQLFSDALALREDAELTV